MLSILAHLFNHLKAQAPMAEAYDALTFQLNTRFHKVLECLWELKKSSLLARVVGSSVVRGGEGPNSQNRPLKQVSEFQLWDEDSDDSLQFPSVSLHDDDDDDKDKYIRNAIIGIPKVKQFPSKTFSENEQQIWLAVSWPSTLANTL